MTKINHAADKIMPWAAKDTVTALQSQVGALYCDVRKSWLYRDMQFLMQSRYIYSLIKIYIRPTGNKTCGFYRDYGTFIIMSKESSNWYVATSLILIFPLVSKPVLHISMLVKGLVKLFRW